MRDTTVALVNPPKLISGKAKWLPLGLGYMAVKLINNGFKVKAIDADTLELSVEQVVALLRELKPDIVGITAMTPQINAAWQIARLTKSELPDILTVLGGIHPTVLPEESAVREDVDVVVIGEGEYTLLEIAQAVDESRPLKTIKGIIFKDNGLLKRTTPRDLVPDLDVLPFPAREIFPFPDKYSPGYYRRLPYATIITSRGCPGRCYFCNVQSIFGKLFRRRSPENVVEEMEYLNKEYGIREFHISDDNFSTDIKRAIDICRLIIKKRLNIVWACSNGIRVDCITPELLKMMRKAGCYRVAFGIESGSEKILDAINKRISLEKIINAVKMARKAGIITVGFFMVGNYGETDKTIDETINLMKKLPLDYAQFTTATPYPGTKLNELVQKEGRVFAKDWSDFDIYTGSVFEWNNLPKKKIDEFQKRMYRAFYFRPSYLIRRVFSLRYPDDVALIKNGFKMLFNVMRLRPPER